MIKVKLFTHIDLDGIGCTILANIAFNTNNVNVEYCDYKDIDKKVTEFIESGDYKSYDMVYITDISVSDSVAEIIDAANKGHTLFALFDHHPTALVLNKYKWCIVETENGDVKTSGTELFYKYLTYMKFMNIPILFGHGNNIDEFVTLVRNWDTWQWNAEPEEFGIKSKRINDLFHIYGRDKFITWSMEQIFNINKVSPLLDFPVFSETDLALLEQKQKDIDTYIKIKDEQLGIIQDKFHNIIGVVFAERYFSELGNALCKLHPQLAYVAMIDIGHGIVSYRTIRDDIDLGGEIAHSLGGGGHKKAAGSEFIAAEVEANAISEVFKEWGLIL